MDSLKEYLTNIVLKKHPNCHIFFNESDGRFFIDVLESPLCKCISWADCDCDPVKEQYVLVPISAIQDRMEIQLGEDFTESEE
jgi:hypothetical protein